MEQFWRWSLSGLLVASFTWVQLPVHAAEQAAAAIEQPFLDVQFAIRNGKVAVLESNASIASAENFPKIFQECGFTSNSLKQELLNYLGPLVSEEKLLTTFVSLSRPAIDLPVLTRQLEALSEVDRPTHELWTSDHDWAKVNDRLQAWHAARRTAGSDMVYADVALWKVYDQLLRNPKFANGPLKPILPSPQERARADAGFARFAIAPPFVRTATKLRPTYNVQQWDALQSSLTHDVLRKFECKLWYSDPIESAIKEYLETRGIQVQSYRTSKDVKDAGGFGRETERPSSHAAIRLQRPDFSDKLYGGRIHLDPDPLLRAIHVQAGPQDWLRVSRALYFLLPTADFDRARSSPDKYLCLKKAPPDLPHLSEVVLNLERHGQGGSLDDLAISRTYMSSSVLSRRSELMEDQGFSLKVDDAKDINPPRGSQGDANQRRRVAVLFVRALRSTDDSERKQLPDLPPCAEQSVVQDSANGSTPASSTTDTGAANATAKEDPPSCNGGDKENPCAPVVIKPPLVKPFSPTPREKAQEADRKNHLGLIVERSPGKPWRVGATYKRDGLTPNSGFGFGIAQQKQGSGEFSYSGDFVNFSNWNRRIQWTARGYTNHDPDIGTGTSFVDEQREGAEFRVTADLWRDMHDTSGQLELRLRREHVKFRQGIEGHRIVAADASLTLVRSVDGTASSPRQELNLDITQGHSGGTSFTKGGVKFAARQYAGAFTQWDVRAKAQAASSNTPQSEWIRFGGEESVRGYRSDRTTAKHAWSVQSEYWLPISWTSAPAQLASTLRKTSLAAFADVGFVNRSSTEFSGHKYGAGLGLRFQPVRSAVIRLDLARPLGHVPEHDRRTRVYFTVSSFIPI